MHCPAIPVQGIGRLLIRLPFRISPGPDVSESPRRSIVLGPFLGVALSQPFPPPPPPFLSFPRNLDSPFPRSLLPYSKSSRPEVMRTASEEKRQRKGWWLVGGSREANRRALSALSVDGVFRGGDMESGNSCLAG